MEQARLDRFHASLDGLRNDLRSQLAELGANPDEDSLESELDFGFADSAHSTAERDRVLALVERLREQLKHVDHALEKVADGSYGICDRCKEPIPAERLEGLPYSTMCVSCKQLTG